MRTYIVATYTILTQEISILRFTDFSPVHRILYFIVHVLLWFKVIKVDPNNGNVVCSVQLPAVSITNLAFGECPNAKNRKLNCIYVTTRRVELTSPTINDGALFLIENSGSEGVLPYKVEYDQIINNTTRPARFILH